MTCVSLAQMFSKRIQSRGDALSDPHFTSGNVLYVLYTSSTSYMYTKLDGDDDVMVLVIEFFSFSIMFCGDDHIDLNVICIC